MVRDQRCVACGGPKREQKYYLCGKCWFELPTATRKSLWRRDARASQRLAELYRAVRDGEPLRDIRVTT